MAPSDARALQDELASVNDIIKSSDIVKAIKTQTAMHDVEIIKLEKYLEGELKGARRAPVPARPSRPRLTRCGGQTWRR